MTKNATITVTTPKYTYTPWIAFKSFPSTVKSSTATVDAMELELLNRAYQEVASPQSQYGKIRDLKEYAQAVNFLQEHSI